MAGDQEGEGDSAASGASLAARLRAGESGAENEFVAAFRQPLLSLARWRVDDPHMAEELVQDVLMSVIQSVRAGRLRDDPSLPGFVRGTARNLMNNYHRRRASVPRVVPLESVSLAAEPLDVLHAERLTLARRAVAELDAPDRELVALTLAEELTSEQIGRRIGLSADAVRMRRSRLLKRLAQRVQGWLHPAPVKPPSHGEEGEP